ncbi:flagellar filament capping protein FliD [Sphingomonas bacterium]|uniref:flagellar filament capping protein FliD n=1 Tax=Sphingomonas bacterium TaxID=1895847 RepID=UPI001575BAB9|nr:flagellar filament capping protein FliD [Sphingomonas bacterium]
MTTTTSTTAAATTPASTQSVVSTAAQSLLTSLGSGSGVDTSSLVTSLVTAQYATQDASLTSKYDALTSQISSVASVKNAITSFSSALGTLVKGGTLTTQPVSSNSGVLSATALPGAKLAGLSSSITVSQLASAQTAVTANAIADRTAAIGTGQLTLTLGTATYSADGTWTGVANGAGAVTIDLTSANDSLDGIAAAINARKAGVTAAVVTDADGSAYLSLKGATGKAQAFTLQATTDDSGALAQFNVGPGASGTTLSSVAQNARLKVDGASVERTGNTISDLIAGVKLQLTGVSTAAVALTSATPTDALSGAVSDFVDAYNEVVGILKTQTDPINGVLKSDPAAKSLLASLKGMTLANLVPGADSGTPTTLAAIGVGTNRDGTLSLDTTALTNALGKSPQSVEAMFAYSADATSGLSAILSSLTTEATNTSYGLGASTSSYTAAQATISTEQSDLSDRKTAMTTRLTQQFASMNSRVTAYKSTQAFLTNQIAAWNKSSS